MSELVCVSDFEKEAFQNLPKNARDYYRSGAGLEKTLSENRNAFSELRIRPRFMRNVKTRDLSTTVLGTKVSAPIGIAPTAMQRMAHPGGECANAKAAEFHDVVFTLSTISTSSIEEVAKTAPNAVKWFQLYIYNDRKLTLQLTKRAEKAGFKALVLTVDAPYFGIRLADVRNKFTLPSHLRLANFTEELATSVTSTTEGYSASGINDYVNRLFDASLEWHDIEWLKSVTTLPIVLKGILTPEDAIIGADLGVSGIWVSNHGARQVDTTPASIEALPEIVKAVGHRVEIYMDGGVREGTDVFKALALGAKMVFFGRPAIWGLANGGEEGVKRVLEIIKKEFDSVMGLTGCSTVKDIQRDMVVHKNYYSKM
ncbi:hydroxyacid oxidase 1 [Agrilus planipennis]|uniref:(S)-2-hydroxy-acid oxidase n=1 Tax=Agrilus planipennis TaxID=224129 RepID=A0A1W4WMI5_AGRPL|nr:hydroxyacid oxidase 1 [Agrilus planipennis]